ncbi:MAG TPA: hypothetical protein VGG72_05950 [Bryobacteraceae bacterium]|jgi:hypothetical protein
MNCASVDRIVNALLYEGYILYPYRASSVKNHLRFNFGVVYPKSYAESQSGHDAWSMQTQCLASGNASASVEICVRFLRIVARMDGQIHESWQEAVECRVSLPVLPLGTLSAAPVRHEFSLPWEQETEGAIVRTREAVQGVIEASAEAVSKDAWRVTVRILNTGELPAGSGLRRELALPYSLISAHTVLEINGGEFVSLLEPPAEFSEAASACRNEGTWPVLAGDKGQRQTILSSPIILYDHPAIAPESPGDLFDSTEIDEILTLRVQTMSEREKQEARRIDERARRILERVDLLDSEQFSKLHGTFRGSAGESL